MNMRPMVGMVGITAVDIVFAAILATILRKE